MSEKYIEKLRITPDIDKHLLTVEVDRNVVSDEDLIEVKVYDESKLIATARSINREPLVVSMPQDSKLWSPDSPFLYTLKISLKNGDKVLDRVDSYAAMRKYSVGRDAAGIVRLRLNNQPLFQLLPMKL